MSSVAVMESSSGPASGGAGEGLTAGRESRREEVRVLILAPSGNDAQLTAEFIREAGIVADVCPNATDLIRAIDEGCGALLLAEESLDPAIIHRLLTVLAEQPSWSDLPVSLVISRGEPDAARRQRVEAFGRETNVALIERPVRPATLIRAMAVALRTRQRQYQVRDLWTDLKASEARLRRLLEQTAVGLAELDLAGRFTMANDQFCLIAGRPREALLQMRMRDITHPDDAATSAVRRELLFSGLVARSVIEKRYARPDGSAVWVQDHLSAMRDLGGNLCGIAVASADITDRKHAEEAASRSRDEAIAASRAKDDFLAALSHELRTPLNPVLLLASEGAHNPDYPPEARADFDTITRNVSLEARLFEDLLDLTRIAHGKLSLERRAHELHASLIEAIDTVKADLEQKHIRLTCDFRARPAMIGGDPVRLQQVFWNVLKNAVKFTPESGAIAVQSHLSGNDRVVVSITDTGIGMTPDELGRIFDTFAQGDHAAMPGAHRFGGLGLGLAITKKIVELHGGSIAATSGGRNSGATFTIELPLANSATEPAETREEVAIPPTAFAKSTALRRRVLLVEDHEPTRVALARLLTRRGFQVFTANSLADARAIVLQTKIDLLLSDIGLPDGTGYELMRELRAREGLVGVALTGYGQETDVNLSREAGFFAHLTKPVDIRSLDKILAEVMV